jgi:TonB family protein
MGTVRRQKERLCMNRRITAYVILGVGLWSVLGRGVTSFAAELVTDPPNGFKAKSIGATRLAGEEAKLIKLISRGSPPQFYPKEALALRRTGRVLLDVLIDADGNVKDALVLDENPLGLGFGDAAIAAARTYKFTNPYGKMVIIRTPTQFAP